MGVKPLDDDLARSEMGRKQFLQNCLYHGCMVHQQYYRKEKEIDQEEEDSKLRIFDFEPPNLDEHQQFNYN